jgi:hypothetical protein
MQTRFSGVFWGTPQGGPGYCNGNRNFAESPTINSVEMPE